MSDMLAFFELVLPHSLKIDEINSSMHFLFKSGIVLKKVKLSLFLGLNTILFCCQNSMIQIVLQCQIVSVPVFLALDGVRHLIVEAYECYCLGPYRSRFGTLKTDMHTPCWPAL